MIMKLLPAVHCARKIESELLPLCNKIEVAGSVRRERAEVNDIDLVLIPRNGLAPILERMTRNCVQESGRGLDSRNLRFRMKNGFQIDLFIAHGDITDLAGTTPTNWGAVYLLRTGSKYHNMQLCDLAISKGMKFAPYRGVMNGDTIVASATEEEIYDVLGLAWRAPTERETLSVSSVQSVVEK